MSTAPGLWVRNMHLAAWSLMAVGSSMAVTDGAKIGPSARLWKKVGKPMPQTSVKTYHLGGFTYLVY
jgi:hypothetical protein